MIFYNECQLLPNTGTRNGTLNCIGELLLLLGAKLKIGSCETVQEMGGRYLKV